MHIHKAILIVAALLLFPSGVYSAECKVDGQWYPYSSPMCKNPPPVKKRITTTKPEPKPESDKPTTNGGYVACLQKSWLDDILAFTAAKDMDSVQAYKKANKCIVLKGGFHVTVTEDPSMPGGTTEFAFNGVTMWTLREAINY